MSRRGGKGRREFKFVVPVDRRDAIIERLGPFMEPDPHSVLQDDGSTGYWVHTLYLDTDDFKDYFERLQEKRVRNRLRVRTYGKPGEKCPVFLENKRKFGKWVVKHRVEVCDCESWCSSGDSRPWTALAAAVTGPERYVARSFCQLVEGGRRSPVSVVHYLREVFVPRDASRGDVRLTLDRHVRATVAPSVQDLFAAPEVDLIPPDWMVMEIKFSRIAPGWMHDLTRELRIPVVPVSKFGLSVARGVRRSRSRELRYLTPSPLREVAWTT